MMQEGYMPLPRRVIAISIALMGVSAVAALAQDFPQRPLRLVTQEVGGGPEFAARQLAQGLAGPLGQPVIVENRGGGGSFSGEIVAKAVPDGHTLLVTGGSFWTAPLFRKSPYDPVNDFAPISLLVNSVILLVVPPAAPIKSVKDLIEVAKARPGQLNYAAGTAGTITHLTAELFKSMAGVDIVYVPYKGSGPAIIGLIGGQVELMFATSASVAPTIKAGKLRAVAITSPRTSALFPELPTVAATVPGYDAGGRAAMFAPRRTPAAIINRLNREVEKVLNQPEVKERFANIGVEIVASTPAQLAAAVKSEIARMSKMVKDTGLKVVE